MYNIIFIENENFLRYEHIPEIRYSFGLKMIYHQELWVVNSFK